MPVAIVSMVLCPMKVTIRINEKKDKDIYDAISNARDYTKEIKKYIRYGLKNMKEAVAVAEVEAVVLQDIKHLPVDLKVNKTDIKNNLLKNRF